MENGELVLFVARLSHQDAGWRPRLHESLLYTRTEYVKQYGILAEELPFLIFAQSSNKELPPTGQVIQTITELLARGRETGRHVVFVINGWDGLSTNPIGLATLFLPWIHEVNISFRIYAGIPRKFFEVSVSHGVQLLLGRIGEDDEDLVIPWDTELFVTKVRNLYAAKNQISVDFTALRIESWSRNTPPEVRNPSRELACTECGMTFPNTVKHNQHMNRHHAQIEHPRCKYCGMKFTQLWPRDRHEKETCKKRPGYVPPAPKPRAVRGSKSQTARREKERGWSGNGIRPYIEIETNTLDFPRVDTSAVLEDRLIYKGEVWCRHPGCVHQNRYSSNAKLRTHYKSAHNFEYPSFPAGELSEKDGKVHKEGLEWLARCMHYGRDRLQDAGPQPVPPKLPKRQKLA